MKFTKLLSLAMALLLLAATMVACGGGNDTTAPDTTKAPDAPDTTEAPAPETNPPETTEHVHSHKIKSSETVKPTCTEAGSKTYVCDCGDSYTEPTEATGHAYKSGNDNTGKYTKYVCSTCDDTYYTAVGSETKLDKVPDGLTFIDYAANLSFTTADDIAGLTKKGGSDTYQVHEIDETTQNGYYSIKYDGRDAWWDVKVAKDGVAAKYIMSMDVQYTGTVPKAFIFKIRGQNAAGSSVMQHLLVIDSEGYLCRYDYTATSTSEQAFTHEQYAWGFPLIKLVKLKDGEWQNLAVIVDDNDGDFDVYVDKKLVAADCPMLYTPATTENVWPGMNNGSARARFVHIPADETLSAAAQVVATLNCDNAQLFTYMKGILD